MRRLRNPYDTIPTLADVIERAEKSLVQKFNDALKVVRAKLEAAAPGYKAAKNLIRRYTELATEMQKISDQLRELNYLPRYGGPWSPERERYRDTKSTISNEWIFVPPAGFPAEHMTYVPNLGSLLHAFDPEVAAPLTEQQQRLFALKLEIELALSTKNEMTAAKIAALIDQLSKI